jgi:hypothetical protein
MRISPWEQRLIRFEELLGETKARSDADRAGTLTAPGYVRSPTIITLGLGRLQHRAPAASAVKPGR